MRGGRLFYFYLLFVSLLIGLSACSATKESNTERSSKVFDEPHILIMTLEVENNKEGIQVKVLQKSLVKGMMKKAHLDHSDLQVGDWKAAVVNIESEVLEWTKLENPLLYRAEFINDAGVLETKAVIRDSGEISIRLPVLGEADRLIVERILENQNELFLEIDLNSL